MPGFALPRGANLSCLAFADDLLLVASDASKAQDLLDATVDYLGALGMSPSAPKSLAYQTYLYQAMTYLGVNYSLWCGIDLGKARADLTTVLARVSHLALKPTQKLDLVQRYLIPAYLHQLVIALSAASLLREIDQELLVWAKRTLRLPQSICNGVIHCGM